MSKITEKSAARQQKSQSHILKPQIPKRGTKEYREWQYEHSSERKQIFNRRWPVTKTQRDQLSLNFTARNTITINLPSYLTSSNNALARKKIIYKNIHEVTVGQVVCTSCKRDFKNTERFGRVCFCKMTQLQKWQFKQKLLKRNQDKLQSTIKAFRFRQTLDTQKEQERLKEQERVQSEVAWKSQDKASKDKHWADYLKTRPPMLAFLDNDHYFNLYGCKRE